MKEIIYKNNNRKSIPLHRGIEIFLFLSLFSFSTMNFIERIIKERQSKTESDCAIPEYQFIRNEVYRL